MSIEICFVLITHGQIMHDAGLEELFRNVEWERVLHKF